MKMLVLYQDIQSGAKIATEEIISAYKNTYPDDTLIVYKQKTRVFTGLFAFMLNMLWSTWDFHKILSSTRDVDIIFSTLFTYAIPWRLSQNRSTPAIFQMHGDQRFQNATGIRPALKRAYRTLIGLTVAHLQQYALQVSTRVAFVSNIAQQEFLNETGAQLSESKAFIIPNGVNTRLFQPVSSRRQSALRKYHGSHDGIHIGYVGRMDGKKGVHNLLNALPYILTPLTVWIAYPEPVDSYSKEYLVSLRRIVAQMKSAHSIHFLQNPASVTTVYHLLDYLVLPSSQEMLPLVVLEGLACGVLPLATNVGGTKKILHLISDALILPSSSPRDIANHLQRVMTMNRAAHGRLVTRGQHIAKLYSWKKSAVALHNEAVNIIRP